MGECKTEWLGLASDGGRLLAVGTWQLAAVTASLDHKHDQGRRHHDDGLNQPAERRSTSKTHVAGYQRGDGK